MLEVTFFGEYALKVINPVVLIQNVIGSNPKDKVLYSDILEDQFKTKFVEKLTMAISIVMRKHKIPFGDIQMYSSDMSDELNRLLDEDLVSKYGIEISDVNIADINLTEKSMERVSKIDDATIFGDQKLQSGLMAQASAEALKTAAGNDKGAMMGFMGMHMADGVSSNIMGAVGAGSNSQQEPKQETEFKEPGTLFKDKKEESNVKEEAKVEEKSAEANNDVGNVQEQQTMKFCPNCGAKINPNNKYCTNCGQKLN